MSIFWIIVICLVVVGILTLSALVPYFVDDFGNAYALVVVCVGAALFIGSIFAGIGISDENDKVYVQVYLAQKYTIEKSLDNADLSGFERLELVKQAAELNGEMATRKAEYYLWHHVHYDNTIYDGVELINLGG